MKALIISIMLVVCTVIKAQILFTYEPISHKTGLMINQEISTIGLFSAYDYSKTSNPTYNFTQYSFTGGISLKFDDFSVLAGATYNNIDVKYNYDALLKTDLLHSYSFSVGFIAHITDVLSVSALTDPLNWQTQIGIGFKLW